MKKSVFAFVLVLFAAKSFAQVPYTKTTVVSGLSYPIEFVFTPDDNRFLITQKDGLIKVNDFTGNSLGTFYDLTDSVYNDFERGLLGICVDPDYLTNHYVYVYYIFYYNNVQASRIERFTDVNNVGTNPTVIVNIPLSNSIPGNHVGGNIRFRPSDPDHIYFSIGDLASGSNAQMLTNPFGKMNRVEKTGLIPTDNPFYDDGNPLTGNCDYIWSYGHRNPFDFTFGPNDSLYISENGLNTQDEFNLGRRGGNYGWQICEGALQYGSSQPCNDPNLINPLTIWNAPLQSVTGVIYYTGCMFPQYKNHIIIGNNDQGQIFDLKLGNLPEGTSVLSNTMIGDVTTTGGLTGIQQGPEGAIYAMYGGYAPNGAIYKLWKNPDTLSVTPGDSQIICLDTTTLLHVDTAAGYTYQWTRNGAVIAGANNADYSPTVTGMYAVSVTDSASGCFISSDSVHVTVTFCAGINEVSANYFSVYPNPSNTEFTIQLKSNASLSLIDATGKKVFESRSVTPGTIKIGKELKPGMYILEVKTKDGKKFSEKLFKSR